MHKNIVKLKVLPDQGVRRQSAQTLENFYDFSLNVPLATLIFSIKFAGRPPRDKLIIHYLDYEFLGGEAPEHHRKFKNFL